MRIPLRACFQQGSDEEKAVGRSILVEVLEAVRIVAVLLSPVTPKLSEDIYLQLGFTHEDFVGLRLEDCEWGGEDTASKDLGLSVGGLRGPTAMHEHLPNGPLQIPFG